jgi:hypothetical protein
VTQHSWGGGGWGRTPWGGGSSLSAPMELLSAIAIAENVVELTFSEVPFFSGLLDANDGSVASHYSMAPVQGTVGLDGSPVRPCAVLFAVPGALATQIDLILDRPMTPIPAAYTVTVSGLVDANTRTPMVGAAFSFPALYRRIVPPQLDTTLPSRDIANPQTGQALLDPLPNTTDPTQLGTFVVDELHDYAFDEGLTALKKRVFRRWLTRKNGFAHLPGYGIGVREFGKRLASPAVRSRIAADAQAQIGQEPEVASVVVTSITPAATPMLCRFVNQIRTKSNQQTRFGVVVPMTG